MVNVYHSNKKKEELWGQELIYSMPRKLFNEISGEKFDSQKVIDYINDTYTLLGVVTEIHIEG